MEYRQIVTKEDRDVLLELHCNANYAGEASWAKGASYEEYCSRWLSTPQPAEFLSDLEQTMSDPRTIAEILVEGGSTIGYIWVAFTDLAGYDLTVAEVKDVVVASGQRRRGIGRKLLERTAKVAREREKGGPSS